MLIWQKNSIINLKYHAVMYGWDMVNILAQCYWVWHFEGDNRYSVTVLTGIRQFWKPEFFPASKVNLNSQYQIKSNNFVNPSILIVAGFQWRQTNNYKWFKIDHKSLHPGFTTNLKISVEYKSGSFISCQIWNTWINTTNFPK